MPPPPAAEVVRLLFEARSAGDVRRICALLDPEIEATTTEGRRYHGLDGVREYFAAQADGARTEVCAHRIEGSGNGTVIAWGRIRVVGRGSLADSPAAWRFEVRDGVVASIAPHAP